MTEQSPSRNRVDWEDLPARTQGAIESLVGHVEAATSSDAGLNSHLASALHVPGGKVFAKGLPSDHRSVYRQYNEAAMWPSVDGISPRVLHHVDTGGWNVLIFEYFDGRHADLAPGSPDLAAIPPMAHELLVRRQIDRPVSLPLEETWARFGDDLNLKLLAGDSLVHTDPNRCNILIGGARSVLVDWALPGRGASWLNLAFMVSSLICEGSSPGQAECWAGQFREWTDADPHAIDTFTTALVRRRQEQASTSPQPRRTERRRLAYFARTWLDHRRRIPDPPSPHHLKASVAPPADQDPDASMARSKKVQGGDRDPPRTTNPVHGR